MNPKRPPHIIVHPGPAPAGARLFRPWVAFWFTPVDPVGLHVVRVLAGCLFLAWLLPFAGHVESLFGLQGWFDRQAISEAARLPGGPPQPLSWSVIYLCGNNAALLQAVYWASVLVLVLFTLGVATRLTAILTWVVVASFTASPAVAYDADILLLILAFYLMVGYVLLGQRTQGISLAERLLGWWDTALFAGWLGRRTSNRPPSLAANVALRLLQVHLALVMLVSGLFKLQIGAWWSGMALWYPLHPPFQTTAEAIRALVPERTGYLIILSVAAYAVLAWQIGFPYFAWRPRWRLVLLGGALLGWLGEVVIYKLPLFGPAIFIGCLAYLTPEEWHRLLGWLGRVPGLSRLRDRHATGMRDEGKGTKKGHSGLGSSLIPHPSSLILALVALLGASCAPIDPPPTGTTKPATSGTAASTSVKVSEPARVPNSLKDRVELAIDQVRQRDLLTTNGFWTVFHGILGLGPSITLLNPETKQRVNALEYISSGGPVRGLEFIPTPDGVDVMFGKEMFVSQGHQDQFVAEMTQWGLPPEHRFLVGGQPYTFRDFIHFTQMRARVNAGQELEWALLVIGNYLGTDIAWTNHFGEKLRFEDLLRAELSAPMDTAPCGGSHRLFGLDWVYHLHLQRGGKTEGVWKEIADNAVRHQQLARNYQNADGSFSTSFFKERGTNPDMERRINTTGHTLEWLALSLPDAELKAAWVEAAVNALTQMIFDIQDKPMEGGSLYHAVHGLLIYAARVYDARSLGPNKPLVPLPPGQKQVTGP